MAKYTSPCDEGCSFDSFNYETNYSTCICPIVIDNKEKKIIEKFEKEINVYKNIKER